MTGTRTPMIIHKKEITLISIVVLCVGGMTLTAITNVNNYLTELKLQTYIKV